MAFTERYVTAAAAGGGTGTSGDPWTLAEAFAAAVAGDRVNIQSGAYSSGADTIDGVGTISQLIVFRGYNSTIGDLEAQGRNSNGELNTTNFPVITCTGAIVPSAFSLLMNIYFTASSQNGAVVGDSTNDNWIIVGCKILNSTNNAAARGLYGDNNISVIDCDISCSGASHGLVIEADAAFTAIGCRFQLVADSSLVKVNSGAVVINNIFIGNATGTGLNIDLAGVSVQSSCVGNTFYSLNIPISYPNAAMLIPPLIIGNHATDCAEWIDNQYSATANVAVVEIANRTRDNTTPRTGIGDGILSREVTTDTGGAATDYVDVSTGNFHLIPDAPGVGKGLGPYQDIGAAPSIPFTPAQIAEAVWTRTGRTLTA